LLDFLKKLLDMFIKNLVDFESRLGNIDFGESGKIITE